MSRDFHLGNLITEDGDLMKELEQRVKSSTGYAVMGQGIVEMKIHDKVISGFQALRQARAPVAGLEPTTEWSLQISGRTHEPLCHRRPERL
ncbi:hypothetical protein PoB_006231900 [Plakobranchus ocellatus]|uniref:Uncharacterized protein n=1 Tax=Plakobranchus ocellatus TaxID=259542 RepID=A0AAV4CVA7_9GAST|nr:hypothetical protein PoB_006231900 [Plakobranchus ocellatus]